MMAKRCDRCGLEEREEFFRIHDRKNSARHVRPKYRRCKCRLCDQTAKDKDKSADRFLDKVTSTRRHHADRLGYTTRELEEQFGWKLSDMAHDCEHASKNGCPYCRHPFAAMAHGLRDITLDIVDPSRDPNYHTNCRWVCATCNSAKQKTPPDLWGEYLLYAERWRKRQEELKKNSLADLPLFSYMDDN